MVSCLHQSITWKTCAITYDATFSMLSSPAGTTSKGVPGINAPIFDASGFVDRACETFKDIGALPANEQAAYQRSLKSLIDNQVQLSSDISIYSPALLAIAKDLQSFFINIKQTTGSVARSATMNLGVIYDPRLSKKDKATGAQLLGRQVVFSVNATSAQESAHTRDDEQCRSQHCYRGRGGPPSFWLSIVVASDERGSKARLRAYAECFPRPGLCFCRACI